MSKPIDFFAGRSTARAAYAKAGFKEVGEALKQLAELNEPPKKKKPAAAKRSPRKKKLPSKK